MTPEMAAAVADAVKAHQGRCGVKGKEIARAIGVSANTVADVLNGLRHGRWGETVIALDKWLEAELGRERNARPDDFVRTRVAETVFTVAEVASALKRIGLVYGWAGIGKTTALRAVAADKPGSVFVSVKTTSASPMGVLQAIAAGFSLRDVYNNNQRGLTDRLEQLLKGTPRLIIVDEIHKLCGTKDDKALHVLSDLYDATTGAPMLWSGTTDLVSYLDRQQAKGREPPAQIRSRICVARDLSDCGGGNGGDGGTPLYTVDEIRRVCGGGKMRLATDAAAYLLKLANLADSGALRTCRNLVTITAKVNAGRADTLTAAMLRDAHQLLVSRRDFSALQGNMKGDAAAPAAKAG